MLRCLFLAFGLFAILNALPTALACAQEAKLTAANLTAAGAKIGQRVEQILPDRGTVFVKPFDEVGGKNSGISRAVSEYLAENGFNVVPAAANEVRGEIFPTLDQQERISGWRAEVRIVSRSGRSKRFEIEVTNEAEGNAFAGVTGQVRSNPVKLTGFGEQRPVQKPPVKKPTLLQEWIRASPESAYAMRFLVKDATGNYQPRSAEMRDNTVMVRLEKGEIYAIELWNGTQWDASAKLFIDGLSRFAISEDKTMRGASDIVSRNSVGGGKRQLTGWVKNAREVFSFKIFGADDAPGEILRNMVAAESDDEIGTIAVTFQTAYSKDEAVLPNERESMTVMRNMSQTITRMVNGKPVQKRVDVKVPGRVTKVGSGRGPVIGDSVRMVQREFGLLREVIRVHYYGTR
ncbi:MAG: hypothetical protein AAGG44_06625 [Planctomycetota bacterium]